MIDITDCLRGEVLYGNDFGDDDIAAWYRDEQEGYANLGAKNADAYAYVYHAWNRLLGFNHVPLASIRRALGFGSAYGDEMLPIIGKIDHITIVDPSAAFARPTVHGKPAKYVKPAPNGRLALNCNAFDLITCLGVLHHIPNVSFVVAELARVLTPGGYLLLREPIVSMGDWRKPRRGLTKRERGIPLHILRTFINENGLEVVNEALCGFPATPRLFRWLRTDPYNSAALVLIDRLMCWLFRWNLNYHPTSPLQCLRPTSAFFVLRKKIR